MKIPNNINLNDNKLENTTVLVTEGETGANTKASARDNLVIMINHFFKI